MTFVNISEIRYFSKMFCVMRIFRLNGLARACDWMKIVDNFFSFRKMTAIRWKSIRDRPINRTAPANFALSQWTVIQFRLRNFARLRATERSTTQRVSRSFPPFSRQHTNCRARIITRPPPTRETVSWTVLSANRPPHGDRNLPRLAPVPRRFATLVNWSRLYSRRGWKWSAR